MISWKSSKIATDAAPPIITSQLPVSAWHEVIGNPTYADAILDRLVHNAHRIDLSGEGLRRNQRLKS
jgi:DNA replication protein DnaC